MNWINPPEDTSNLFGFIYLITNTQTGQMYVGKKQFHSYHKKSVKGRKNKVTVKKDSDWPTYTSSSNTLNADITKHGLHLFKFEILSCHSTKSELSFAESKEQWTRDVLHSVSPTGTKLFYNRRVEPLRYNKETAKKVSFL